MRWILHSCLMILTLSPWHVWWSSRWSGLSGFWPEGAGSSSTRAGFADMPNDLNAVDLARLVVKQVERVERVLARRSGFFFHSSGFCRHAQ